MLSGGSYTPPISFGFASFDPMTGEWGYLGKKGNSPWQNIGYAFGALANVQDVVAGVNGTNIDVKCRPDPVGHSELGQYQVDGNGNPVFNTFYDSYGNRYDMPVADDILVSVGPSVDIAEDLSGLKWEMEYVKRQLAGQPIQGSNNVIIPYNHKSLTVPVNNVNGKFLRAMTYNLNNGRNLLNTGNLQYGIVYGCVNFTSRALFYSGVLNANALLPITSPLLLEAELAIRQLGIYANPYLIQKY